MRKIKKQNKTLMNKSVMKLLSAAMVTGCVAFNPTAAYALNPTLDTLSAGGTLIPGTNKTYPQSLYNFSEVTPQDPQNLPLNVIEYYNPNIDSEVHYYSVEFKNDEIGTGSQVKYYKWAKDENGIKLVEGSADDKVLTVRYDSSQEIETILNPEGETYNNDIENIYVGQSIKRAIDNKGTMTNVSSRFVGNTLSVDADDTFNYSAVMSEANATINNVNSSFIGNTVTIDSTNGYGTMVKALGTIDNLKSEFIGNTVTTNHYLNGAIVQAPSSGVISTIQSDFIANSAHSTDSLIEGVAIGNAGNIGVIKESLFTGNYGTSVSGDVFGGAIHNSGIITNGVDNSVFTNNYVVSESGNAYGGAISNTRNANVVNSVFKGNYAQSTSGNAYGGAIYTDTDFEIYANNGKTTEFTGNYIKTGDTVTNQAIYVDAITATLTMDARESGKIVLNDAISGRNGYRTLFTGDGSGYVYLNNSIYNSNVTTENINLYSKYGQINNTNLLSLNSDNTAKWTIDVDFIGKRVDTFNLGSDSGGTLYIDKFNDLGSAMRPTEGVILQVLSSSSPSTIQVALSDELIDSYYKFWITDEYENPEAVNADSRWDDEYYTKLQKDEVEEGIRVAKSIPSRTTPDSIEYYINRNVIDLGEHKSGDTLRLLNAMSGTRSFTANSADQTYTVTEDLGSMATGSLTVRGFVDAENDAISKLDAGNHTLFVIDKPGTVLALRDLVIESTNTADGSIINNTAGAVTITGYSTDYPTVIKSAAQNGIINNGTLSFIDTNKQTDVYTGIKGSGVTNVQGGRVNLLDGASIEQKHIMIGGSSASLYLSDTSTIKADLIRLTNPANLSVVADNLLSDVEMNNGQVELRGGTLSHVIKWQPNTNVGGYVVIVGDVVIEHGENGEVKGQVPIVRFTEDSSLTAYANDITGAIQATGLSDLSKASLTLTGGTLNQAVSMSNAFVININGDVEYTAPATNSIVAKTVISNGSTLTAGLNLSNSGLVVNDGTLNLHSTGTTINTVPYISGIGTTNITNYIYSGSVKQANVNIAEGATLRTYGFNLNATDKLVNDGLLILINDSTTGRTISAASLGQSEITGSIIQNTDGTTSIKDTGRIQFGLGNNSSAYTTTLDGITLSQPTTVMKNQILAMADVGLIKAPLTLNTGSTLRANGGTFTQTATGGGTFYVYAGSVTNKGNIYTPISIGNPRSLTTDASAVHKAISISASTTYGNLYLNSTKNSNGDGSSTFALDDGAMVSGKGRVQIAEGANVIVESVLANTGGNYILKNATMTTNADNLAGCDINMNYSGAKLYLTGGELNYKVNGASYGDLHIAGNVSAPSKNITAKVIVDSNGTFTAPMSVVSGSRGSIDNYGTFITSGSLSKAITQNGTTKLSGGLALNSGASIDGTLDVNGKHLSLVGTNVNYNVGNVISSTKADENYDATISLDLNTHTNAASTLTIGDTTSDVIFKLSSVDVESVYGDSANSPSTIQILKGGSNAQLYLEEPLEFHDWDDEAVLLGNVEPDVWYDDEYLSQTIWTDVKGYIELATTENTNDSIKWTITEENREVRDAQRQDLLAAWTAHTFTGNPDKTFKFRTSNDVYESIANIGYTSGAKHSVLGVADGVNTITVNNTNMTSNVVIPQKSTILLGNHSGFEVTNANSQLNISDVTFKDAVLMNAVSDGVIYHSSGKLGTIDAEHNVSGGIYNVDFDNNSVSLSQSGATTQYIGGIFRTGGTNASISQIANTTFTNNKINFTATETVNYSPLIYSAALYIGGTTVGQTYTNAEGNRVNVGGLTNILVENTQGKIVNGVSGNVNFASGILITAGPVSQIKDSIIRNNHGWVDSDVQNRGAGLSIFNSAKIDTIENVLISGNELNSGSKTAYGAGIYMSASSGAPTLRLLKDSLIIDNKIITDAGVASYGAGLSQGAGTITTIDKTKFINNTGANSGGAIYSNGTISTIQNSYFSGNSANGGGALYFNTSSNVGKIKDSVFENNTALTSEGGALYVNRNGNNAFGNISGSTFKNNSAKTYGGAVNVTGSKSSYTKLANLTDTTFEGNKIDTSGNHVYGGAIAISLANSTNWSGLTFTDNYVKSTTHNAFGGAIWKQYGGLTGLSNSTFNGNYAIGAATSQGGAVYMIYDSKGVFDNLTFENNYAKSTSSTGTAYGGGLYYYHSSSTSPIVISAIQNSTFKNNHVEAVGNAYGGGLMLNSSTARINVTTAENLTFEDNYAVSTNGYASGAGIWKSNYSTFVNGIVNSVFKNNWNDGKTGSVGSAIYSAGGDLKIVADGSKGEGARKGLTEFTGNHGITRDTNYVHDDAIYVGRADSTLTLQAINGNAHILMNDAITGTTGYSTHITGDGSGKISLFNNIKGSNVIVDNIVVEMRNNDTTKAGLDTLFDYNFLSLTSDDSAKWNIDIDFAQGKSDNITMANASSGTVYIDNLNILDNATTRTKVQILKTPTDDIQLALNENNINIVEYLVDHLGDTVFDNSNYVQQEGFALSTTDTTNDSIVQLVTERFDNLDLITSSITNEERSFIFNTDNVYKPFVDLKDAGKGTLTIIGKSAGSTIDGDGHSLFNLNDETNLVIKDTTIQNGKDNKAISVGNGNATVVLNNSTIDGDISATERFALTVNGTKTTDIKGAVSLADATLEKGNLKLATNTFADDDVLTLSGGHLVLDNNSVENYSIHTLNASEDTSVTLDMDLSAKSADAITTTADSSNGTVYITALNYLNGNENVEDFETQVLYNADNNDNLQLKVADDLALYKIKNVTKYTDDTVKAVSGFNEKYYVRSTQGELFGSIYTTTTQTTNDTLGFKAQAVYDESSTVIDRELGDTLVLANAADYDERTFQSTNATDTYRLKGDLGTTEGTMNLNGITEGRNISTINLQNRDGFTLAQDSELNVNNVRINGVNENKPDVITVDGTGVEVNLNNANIAGNIKGNENFDLNIKGQGTTTITGDVSNANVNLSKGTLVIGTNTFADENTTLNVSNGIIDMANGVLENYTFNNLQSDDANALYNIDVNLADMTADTITANGSGVIKLEYLNITGILDDADASAVYRIKILNTDSDNLILQLTETTQSELDKDYKLGTQHEVIGVDTPQAATMWDDELHLIERDSEIWGRLDIDDDKHDSLIFSHLKPIFGDPYEGDLGDTLKIWNNADLGADNDKKTFTFDDSDNVYNVKDNLGTTVGSDLKIIGVAGEDAQGNPQNSTINMHEYSGFGISDETEMTVSNVTFKELNGQTGGLFNVSNEDAILNLDNVNIENPSINNVITNAGTVNMTGGTSNLETGISGVGNTNVKGGAVVNIADGYSIKQTAVDVQDGYLTMGDGGVINANLTIQEKGNVVVGVNGIVSAVPNDGNITFNSSGDLANNITGSGTTHIDADIVNKALIDQDVDVKRGASLDSHTDKLGGAINNDGDLTLKGQIAQTITGSGKTTVNESLNLFDGAGVDGTLDLNNGKISSVDDKLSEFNIGKLVNDGNFSIDVDAASKTADKYIVGPDSQQDANINIEAINFKNLSDITQDFVAQVTQGSDKVQVKLSDTLKSTDYDLGRTQRDEHDDVLAVTNYDDLYYKYLRGGTLVGNLVEGKTVYDYDSIKMQINEDKTKWDNTRTRNGYLGDTLNLWNTLETDEDKKFVFDKALGYNWGENATGAGETHGTNVTLQGVSSNETTKSSIDFTGKTGFELVDATTFNIKDMKLTGSDIITVKNDSASINIEDSFINGNLTADSAPTSAPSNYDVTISGQNTTTLKGTFKNADTTLTSGTLKFNTDTFADSTDTLNTSGGNVQMANSTIEDYVINSLTSSADAKYSLDINLANKTADTIAIGTGSGIVTLDNLNILADAQDVDKDYIVQILKVTDKDNSDIQLALSDAVEQQLANQPDSPYKIGETPEYSQDSMKSTTNWKETYDKYQQITETYGTLQLATKDTENDSIGIKVSGTRTLDKEKIGDQGDTLKVVNQSSEVADKTFEFDTNNDVYIVRDGENLGATSGSVTIKGQSDNENSSTINLNNNSGFELGDRTALTIEDTTLTNASGQTGSVINAQSKDADISLKNVNLVNNTSTGEHGGAIYTNSDIDITTDNHNSFISGNKANGENEAIYLGEEAKLTINTVNNANLVISDKINAQDGNQIALTGDSSGNVYLNETIGNANVVMDNITLNLSEDKHFETSDFTINSGVLNLVNNKTQNQIAKNFTVNGDFKLNVDVDLKKQVMDRLPENTVVNNNAFIHVDKINLTSDTESKNVLIPFAYNQFKDNVDYIGPKDLSKSTQVTKAFAPIYKYSIRYESRDDLGYFLFTRGAGAPENSYSAVNPSIMASPVATQVGGYFNQLEALHEGFYHMERYTKYSHLDRMAAENINRYAIADAPVIQRSPLPETSQAMWTKPYATFERVSLDNGPKVKNTAYGAFYGGDSNLKDLGHGWKGIASAFIGYNGNHLSYDSVSTDMQGGVIGATGTFYRGNFFTGLTASVGASAGSASTMYGTDHFTMLNGGIANKTGYDFEIKDGAIIIQPSLFTGYTFVNTFDYTSAANVKLDSDTLHAIQIIPGIKVIGNTKNGWQPYAGVNMVWNIMDKTNVMANTSKLPQLSVKPYVEYGLGLQKSWGDRFTAFGQAMIRNGGRNGIAMSFGFRWAIGKDFSNTKVQNINKKSKVLVTKQKNNIPSPKKKVIKQIGQTNSNTNTTQTSMNGVVENM